MSYVAFIITLLILKIKNQVKVLWTSIQGLIPNVKCSNKISIENVDVHAALILYFTDLFPFVPVSSGSSYGCGS